MAILLRFTKSRLGVAEFTLMVFEEGRIRHDKTLKMREVGSRKSQLAGRHLHGTRDDYGVEGREGYRGLASAELLSSIQHR